MKPESILKILRIAFLPLIAFAVLAGSYLRVMDSYELETLDLRFRLRPPLPVTDKIAIIEISDDTIAKIGRFPFDRDYHAMLVKALSEAGAKAIIFDLFFSEPSPSDAAFAAAVKSAANVYLPIVFEIGARPVLGLPEADACIAKNLAALEAFAKGIGHINVIPDRDGKYRRAPSHIAFGGRVYPYLGLKAACDYLGAADGDVKVSPGRHVEIRPAGRPAVKVPLDERSLMLVNFSGPWADTYRHYSYVDILQSHLAAENNEHPNIDLAALKGKVCIVGLTAVGTVDLHPNPFDPLYPAVGMHAEVFNSVINGSFIRRASRMANLAVLALLCAVISALVMKTKPLRGLFILFSTVSIYTLSCILVFTHFGVWVDIIYPVLVLVMADIALTLYKYVREWKVRLIMENELGIAKKIQESFLPRSMPSLEGADVSARMFTARQVGGDLYDFVSLGGGRLGIMAGDVSGKGVPAALFMAMTVGAFRSFASPEAKPARTLADLNAKLVRESASNLFVTVFYAIFDMKARSFSYASGGHLPVLHMRPSGEAQFLDVKEGAPLGLMEGDYSSGEIKFGRGDIFVFYTDGITEAMNQRSEMYGSQRLQAVVERNRSLDAEKLAEAIERDVRRFEPRRRQHDDMTVIVVKIT